MEQLLKAIYASYSAGAGAAMVALRAANTGGLRTTVHVQGQARPYMVLTHVSSRHEHIMGAGNQIKIATVQFSIFDDTLASALNVYTKLIAAFDDSSLTYTTDAHLVMLHVNETGPTRFEDIWQVTVDYNIWRT